MLGQETRNDAKALRLIAYNYGEGVSPENITRLLNYHFAQVFQCERDARNKCKINRIADGTSYAPPVTIWSQP